MDYKLLEAHNDNYSIFSDGKFGYVHSSDIIRMLICMPHIVFLGSELIDAKWMNSNIQEKYVGVFCSIPSDVPFYFNSREDAFLFKLRYGGTYLK